MERHWRWEAIAGTRSGRYLKEGREMEVVEWARVGKHRRVEGEGVSKSAFVEECFG